MVLGGGVKNFSVGICDGAPSTARSSCFCDGQSSKGNNSKSINDRVIILALCTSTHVG